VAKVSGLAENAKRFEFRASAITVSELISRTWPSPVRSPPTCASPATPARCATPSTFPLSDAGEFVSTWRNGDEVEFTADKKPGTIAVRVEGEHMSVQEYVLPYGASSASSSGRSNSPRNAEAASMQLFRRAPRSASGKRCRPPSSSSRTPP
jgi:hypothetical protein